MSDYIIKVENLGKKYRIRHQQEQQRYVALRDVFAEKLLAPWRWLRERQARNGEHGVRNNGSGLVAPSPNSGLLAPGSEPPASEDFWALRNVSFEVKQGEVVGIIGRNGAGKSTLLKVLSRITEPTEGRVRLRGRVASLLEVGTGFHPELTGRENIYLNGAVLGMARGEIKRKFNEIVAFAEVENFLDTPVKRYSSGMYVRLAFAVAAHLDPEILIVDEVLAVGDAQFQSKCLGKMQDVAQRGRTVLIVSHNMPMISSLCSRTIVLSAGSVASDGDVSEGVQEYMSNRNATATSELLKDRKDRGGNGSFRFIDAYVIDPYGIKNVVHMGKEVRVVLSFSAIKTIKKCDVSIHIDNVWGQVVLRLATRETAAPFNDLVGEGVVTCTIPKLRLLPGKYFLLMAASVPPAYEYLDHISQAAAFEVVEYDVHGTGKVPEHGVFFSECEWQCVPSI